MKRSEWTDYTETQVETIYDKALFQFDLAELINIGGLNKNTFRSDFIYAEIQLSSPSFQIPGNSKSFARRLIFDENYENYNGNPNPNEWVIWNPNVKKPVLRTESEIMWSWPKSSWTKSSANQVFPITRYLVDALEQQDLLFFLLLEGCSPDAVMSWSNAMTSVPSLQIEVIVDEVDNWDKTEGVQQNEKSSEQQQQGIEFSSAAASSSRVEDGSSKELKRNEMNFENKGIQNEGKEGTSSGYYFERSTIMVVGGGVGLLLVILGVFGIVFYGGKEKQAVYFRY